MVSKILSESRLDEILNQVTNPVLII